MAHAEKPMVRVDYANAKNELNAGERPISRVKQGEVFQVSARSLLTGGTFEDSDAYESMSIPVTGPIAIEGVKPGDTLRIDIHVIEIADRGAMVTMPGRGGFSEPLMKFGHVVGIHDGEIHFDETVRIPVRPMIGKLGVAPRDFQPSSSTVGIHGGNMDCRDVVAGSAVLLPVQVEDALLYLGDLHAAQGDGECSLTGVEVEGVATISCRVQPGVSVPRPVVLTETAVVTIGDAAGLDEAARLALDDMLSLLQADQGWSREKSAMLLSAAADVAVSQLVNDRVGAKVTLAQHYFRSSPFTSKTGT